MRQNISTPIAFLLQTPPHPTAWRPHNFPPNHQPPPELAPIPKVPKLLSPPSNAPAYQAPLPAYSLTSYFSPQRHEPINKSPKRLHTTD